MKTLTIVIVITFAIIGLRTVLAESGIVKPFAGWAFKEPKP